MLELEGGQQAFDWQTYELILGNSFTLVFQLQPVIWVPNSQWRLASPNIYRECTRPRAPSSSCSHILVSILDLHFVHITVALQGLSMILQRQLDPITDPRKFRHPGHWCNPTPRAGLDTTLQWILLGPKDCSLCSFEQRQTCKFSRVQSGSHWSVFKSGTTEPVKGYKNQTASAPQFPNLHRKLVRITHLK